MTGENRCGLPGVHAGNNALVMDDARATLPVVIDVVHERGAQPTRMVPPWPPKPPLIPGNINIAISPSITPAIIVIAIIRFVVVTRAIDNGPVILIIALVAGRVTYFHFVVT